MPNRTPPPAVAQALLRVAALSRSRRADDPELVAAQTALHAANIAAYVEKIVADAPPLTDEQREAVLAAFVGIGGSKPRTYVETAADIARREAEAKRRADDARNRRWAEALTACHGCDQPAAAHGKHTHAYEPLSLEAAQNVIAMFRNEEEN